jgi:hypothetical protein
MSEQTAETGELKIVIDGQEYPCPLYETFTYREARTVKKETGLVMGEFFDALERGDSDAIFALAYDREAARQPGLQRRRHLRPAARRHRRPSARASRGGHGVPFGRRARRRRRAEEQGANERRERTFADLDEADTIRWQWQPWMADRMNWQPEDLETKTPKMLRDAIKYVNETPIF